MNVSFYDNLGYSYVAKFSLFNYTETAGTPPVKTECKEGVYRLHLTDVVDATSNESI